MKLLALSVMLILSMSVVTGAKPAASQILPISIHVKALPIEGDTLTIGPKTFLFSETEPEPSPLPRYVWVRLDSCLTIEDLSNRLLLAIEGQVGLTDCVVDRSQSTATLIMLVYAGEAEISVFSNTDAFEITELGV